ncbi:methyl-accepting chemotaxis protein [Kurthia huakuii]|uniref:methyl-accepting chemotaxis protein n=1 Tax=Kurthia huakuii TaxID=1421019 RepID=UPI00049780CA|nr:methyl-accepting chemotaxis protein [Kurthia huakuii]MBM7698388.1 methyl-accepting chemotaxis protein [Kurthia huakuii]
MFKTVRAKIMAPITLIVVLIIAIFSLFIYTMTNNSIKQNGEALVQSVSLGLNNALTARDVAENIMEREMIGQSVMASYIINQGGTYEELKKIAERGDIDEIWSTDDKGNTTETSVAQKIDFNFGADPNGQAVEYMSLLEGDTTQIVQPAQIRDVDGEFFKFVGVSSWDPATPQIIQIARNGEKLLTLEQQIGSEYYMKQLQKQLGDTVLYAAIVNADGKKITATSNHSLTDAGFDVAAIKQEISSKKGHYDGKRVSQFTKKLNNGHYLVLAIDASVLTNILVSTIIAAIVSIIFIAAMSALTITRQIKRILHIRNSLEDISDGDADLTKRIELHSRDEIGQLVTAFNAMMDNLQHIMGDLKSQAGAINDATTAIDERTDFSLTATEQIKAQSIEIAQAARIQFESTEDSTHAMEDLARSIQNISDAITDILMKSNRTEGEASEGVAIVQEFMAQLYEIDNSTKAAVEKTSQLVGLSDRIGEFINIITDIADQTNLLALNASIEAARAGDAGKGFAVVAEEVRKLAEQTKKSADEIVAVVENVQTNTKEVAQAINSTSAVVTTGQQIASKAQLSFQTIAAGIESIGDDIETVSSSSEAMSANTEEITASVEHIQQLARQSVENVNKMVSASEQQADFMHDMDDTVSSLQEISSSLHGTTSKYRIQET